MHILKIFVHLWWVCVHMRKFIFSWKSLRKTQERKIRYGQVLSIFFFSLLKIQSLLLTQIHSQQKRKYCVFVYIILVFIYDYICMYKYTLKRNGRKKYVPT